MLLYLYIPILSILIVKCTFLIVSHNKDNAHWSIFLVNISHQLLIHLGAVFPGNSFD